MVSLWEKIMTGPRTFVIAEAGVNHNGDIELARQLVDAAASSGADAVKFQTFRTDKLVTQTAPKAGYQKVNDGKDGSQSEMLRRLELPFRDFGLLKNYCDSRNILFLSTPFDEESADFLGTLGMPIYKVPSGELTNTRLLKRIACQGRPVIMSTGMSDLDEIETAVRVLKGQGCLELMLLQCVSNYPADYQDMNLRAMRTLSERFKLPVGLSDHTLGIEIAIAAVAMGARVLEKHFTLDKSLPGPDHKASLDPSEFKAMVGAIRNVEVAIGDGVKRVQASEADVRLAARRSLVAARQIMAGEVLKAEDLCFKRPGTGIPPGALSKVVGRCAAINIAAETVISLEMLA
jgi:N-acetylneuraminate synthase/N,N'-diacetyllegionaminate synthase